MQYYFKEEQFIFMEFKNIFVMTYRTISEILRNWNDFKNSFRIFVEGFSKASKKKLLWLEEL